MTRHSKRKGAAVYLSKLVVTGTAMLLPGLRKLSITHADCKAGASSGESSLDKFSFSQLAPKGAAQPRN